MKLREIELPSGNSIRDAPVSRFPMNSNVTCQQLAAGPVRLTLANGELRYLYVGQREIVRRLYFCVRFHDKWDTVTNEITRCDVRSSGDAFEIALDARAVTGPVNYGWTARITGDTDGTITYAVKGMALAECTQIRRTGIQLLLGADAVIGQPFAMTRTDGSSLRRELQVRLDPEVLPMQFKQLSYTTREGLDVSAEFSGATFGYEDQRNFNDSSFKFFSAHAHSYPTLAQGVVTESSVTLRLKNLPNLLPKPATLCARVLSQTGGSRVPRITEAGASTPNSLFMGLNKNRPAQWESKLHTWGFTPAVNLYDDDTFMENVTAVLDQVRTARVFTNPHGTDIGCRIDPVHFESLHPRAARDSRNHGAFAAAWLVAFIKYASIASVLDVALRLGHGPVDTVRSVLAARAHRRVRPIQVKAPERPPVEAFGIIDDDRKSELWFANTTGKTIRLPVEFVPPGDYIERGISDVRSWDRETSRTVGSDGTTKLELAPFEICVLTP